MEKLWLFSVDYAVMEKAQNLVVVPFLMVGPI